MIRTQQRIRRSVIKPHRPQTPEPARASLSAEERDAFYVQMRADLERLKADPEAWADYRREQRAWEAVALIDAS